jgi:hypothetical protein
MLVRLDGLEWRHVRLLGFLAALGVLVRDLGHRLGKAK